MSLKTKLPFNYHYGEWFIAVLLSFITAGCAWWWLTDLRHQESAELIITATHDLPIRHTLVEGDITTRSLSAKLIPPSALRTSTALLGKVITHSVAAGEILVKNDIVAERDPASDALLIPEGQTGFVLPAAWLTAPLPRIKPNDVVSVYTATPLLAGTVRSNGLLLKAAPVLRVNSTKDGAPESIFIAVTPATVAALLQARASQFHIVVVAEPGRSTAELTPPAKVNTTSTEIKK